LILTFTECAKHKNLIPRTFVNPIRNDNILRTILYHTVPPHITYPPNDTNKTKAMSQTRNVITPNIITIPQNNTHTDDYYEDYNLDYNTIINKNTIPHEDGKSHDHNDAFIPTGTDHLTNNQDNYYTPYRDQINTHDNVNIASQPNTQPSATDTPNTKNFTNQTHTHDTTNTATGNRAHHNTNTITKTENRSELFHDNQFPSEDHQPHQYPTEINYHHNQDTNRSFDAQNHNPTTTARHIPPPLTPNPFLNNTFINTNQNQRQHPCQTNNRDRNANQSTTTHGTHIDNKANTPAQMNTQHHNITHEQIERIIERNVARKETSDTRYKQYNKLSPSNRLVLRRMCAVDIYDEEPTEPSESYLDIANSSQSVQYTSFVTQLLKSKKVLGRWASNHIARFIYNGPMWLKFDDPLGLTMLGINCTGPPDRISQKNIQFAIQSEMEQKLDKEEIQEC
jgi:hypothetical protein